MSRLDEQQLIIKKACRSCKELYQIHTYKEDYVAWKNGQLIQETMPYVPGNMRELLISGFCESCFDGMFEIKNS